MTVPEPKDSINIMTVQEVCPLFFRPRQFLIKPSFKVSRAFGLGEPGVCIINRLEITLNLINLEVRR